MEYIEFHKLQPQNLLLESSDIVSMDTGEGVSTAVSFFALRLGAGRGLFVICAAEAVGSEAAGLLRGLRVVKDSAIQSWIKQWVGARDSSAPSMELQSSRKTTSPKSYTSEKSFGLLKICDGLVKFKHDHREARVWNSRFRLVKKCSHEDYSSINLALTYPSPSFEILVQSLTWQHLNHYECQMAITDPISFPAS